jgi:hypothetical protein
MVNVWLSLCRKILKTPSTALVLFDINIGIWFVINDGADIQWSSGWMGVGHPERRKKIVNVLTLRKGYTTVVFTHISAEIVPDGA